VLLQVADQVSLLLQDVVQERLIPAVKKLDIVTWSLALDTDTGWLKKLFTVTFRWCLMT